MVSKPTEDRGDNRTPALTPSTSLGPASTKYTTRSYRADNEAPVASSCCCSLHPVRDFTGRHATCHCVPQPAHHWLWQRSSCPHCEPAHTHSKRYFVYFTEIHLVKMTSIISILQLSFQNVIVQLTSFF